MGEILFKVNSSYRNQYRWYRFIYYAPRTATMGRHSFRATVVYHNVLGLSNDNSNHN
jgi:hypothetical protein